MKNRKPFVDWMEKMQIYFHCRTIFHLLLLFIDRNGNYIFSFSCGCCALHTAHWLSTFWHIIFFSFLCWFWFCLVSGGFSCIDWMCRFAFPLVSSSTSWICNDFFFLYSWIDCLACHISWPLADVLLFKEHSLRGESEWRLRVCIRLLLPARFLCARRTDDYNNKTE